MDILKSITMLSCTEFAVTCPGSNVNWHRHWFGGYAPQCEYCTAINQWRTNDHNQRYCDAWSLHGRQDSWYLPPSLWNLILPDCTDAIKQAKDRIELLSSWLDKYHLQ